MREVDSETLFILRLEHQRGRDWKTVKNLHHTDVVEKVTCKTTKTRKIACLKANKDCQHFRMEVCSRKKEQEITTTEAITN